MDAPALRLLSLSILALLAIGSVSSACIGLVAGKVHFNVTAGGNQTLQMQIFNSCQNQSIGYEASARFSPVANQIVPKIIINPANGTMAPASQVFLNITVYMPSNAIPNTTWSGGAIASEVVTSSSGGATVTTGVIKKITATALAAPVNYALYAAIGVAVVVGAGGIAVYYKIVKKGARPAKKAAKKAKLFRLLPKKEKKMTYAEFKAMEAGRSAERKRPANKKGAQRRTSRRTSRRR